MHGHRSSSSKAVRSTANRNRADCMGLMHAGASQSALVEDTTLSTAQQIMEINATGNMNMARAWLPCMLSQGCGRIVPVASMAGRVASPGQAEYAAAKHALVGYFSSMASEVAGRGVGVTIVCPGPIAGGLRIRTAISIVPGHHGPLQRLFVSICYTVCTAVAVLDAHVVGCCRRRREECVWRGGSRGEAGG